MRERSRIVKVAFLRLGEAVCLPCPAWTDLDRAERATNMMRRRFHVHL